MGKTRFIPLTEATKKHLREAAIFFWRPHAPPREQTELDRLHEEWWRNEGIRPEGGWDRLREEP